MSGAAAGWSPSNLKMMALTLTNEKQETDKMGW
jgi:hypothetical protein